LDFFGALRSKPARRQFVAFCLVAAILVLVLHFISTYWLQRAVGRLPSLSVALLETSTHLTGGLFAGITTAAFLLFVSRSLYPHEESLKAVDCVDHETANDLHDSALATAEYWLHSGHIGRWVRVHAIPALARMAREGGIETRIVFHILDPNDTDQCNEYSTYRARIRYQEPGFKTVDDTKAEILATVLAACLAKTEHPGLNIEIYFRRSIDHTRLDICSSLAFRTMVKPCSPAIVYHNLRGRQHTFYAALKLGFEKELAYARRFHPVGELSRSGLDEATVAKFLDASGLEYPKSEGFIHSVIERTLSEFTPYE